jgi:hypothetical protein
MDQRSFVRLLYLHLTGLLAHEIHDDLVATLGLKGVAYSTVMGYLCDIKLDTAKVTRDQEPNPPHLDDSDQAFLAAREENPFSSVRELVRVTYAPRAIVYRRLTKSHWFVRSLLPWVPTFCQTLTK